MPPAWLIDQYVALARSARATADAVTNQALPAGTDSINIPRITTGTTTAIQANSGADGGTVAEQAIVDAVVTAPVVTIAGQASISQQLIDQSPINFDEVIFKDLAAAYNTNVDTQVISGLGTTQQVKGILNATGIIAITYTDSAPTVTLMYTKINDAIQRIYTQRFASPTVVVMHPRRWAWMLTAADTTGRPLIVPNGAQFNSPGTFNQLGSQTIVGQLAGVPVLTDPNLPVNLGAGTNQDVILVMKADDLILWESSTRTQAYPGVLSGTLQVRLQLYGYLAFTAERQPKSVCVISGTSLTTPTF